MGDSLPSPALKEIDRGLKIVFEESEKKFYEINIFKPNEKPREVCGVLVDGVRCRKSPSECFHREIVNSHRKKLETPGNLIQLLQDLKTTSMVDMDLEFSYLLDLAQGIDKEDLDTLDVDLRFQYAMLMKIMNAMNSNEGVVAKSARREASEILRNIIKTKELRVKMKEDRKIDPKYLQEFIGEMFGVAKRTLPKEYYERFVQAVKDEVVTPRQVMEVSGKRKVEITDAEVVNE